MERYHHGALREALLDAAESRIAAGEEPSLRELARATSVSPASVYHHFEDKDALLVALAVRGFERLLAAQQRAIAGRSAEAALRALGDAYLAFAEAEPASYRLMMRKDLSRPDKYPALTAAADATFDVLLGVLRPLRAGVGEEAVRAEALELWATAHGMASLWELGPLRGKLAGTPLRAFAAGVFERAATRGSAPR